MGGKSGGGGHTPVEAPDSLRSSQTLSVLDVWCEGQIFGLATGDAKSIYLNETPVLDKSGNANLSGVGYEYRVGTQGQEILKNVPSVTKETQVGLEVKHGLPLVRTVTDENIDRLRLTVGVTSLKQISEDNGDTNGTSVQFQISFNNSVVLSPVIEGKTNSQYLRNYVFSNLPPRPFTVKVERLTADSTSQLLSNSTVWQGYTEIVDAKLAYPNTALCGLKFDSEQFQGVPRRNYHLKGMIVKVPTNYNPESREYSGLWDGTFKLAYTNNPAWVFYDLVANNRYGLGELLGGYDGIDKAQMYQISQYCDELVDDGYGGKEPRMTLNCWITEQKQAHQIISDLCSVFRGMPVWDGLQLSTTIDRPQDTAWIYTQANVVDGKFTYQSSALKARHTACEVEYIDPDHAWKKQVEHVQDDKAIGRYGYNVNKITAFGCTSRGQARRLGRWLLETEKLERQTVNFSVGANGLNHLPGDVIEIADSNFSGVVSGGRVAGVSDDLFTITLDREIDAKTAGTLTVINEHGKPEKTNIVTVSHDNKTVTVADSIQSVKRGSVWTLQSDVVATRKFRAIGIKENEDGTYSINALQHVPEKQSIVDTGYVFESRPETIFGGDIPAVEHLNISADNNDNESYQIRATWETPRLISDIKFQCELKTNTEPTKIVKRQTVNEMAFDAGNLPLGAYTLTVRGINNVGQLGDKQTIAFEIAPPKAPKQLIVVSDNFSVTVRPVAQGVALGSIFEFWHCETQGGEYEFLGNGYILNHQGLKPDTEHYYKVRTVNAVGRSDFVTANIKTKLNPNDILDLVGSSIPSLDWAQDLINQVETNTSGVVLLKDRAALVVNKDNRISGITVTADDQASAVDFLADFVSFTDPDTLQRNLYWDNAKRTLVLRGQLQLLDGKVIDTAEDIKGEKGDKGDTGATGATGAQGAQGIPGLNGSNGEQFYTWIRYADNSSGAGFSDSPVNKKYMGIAVNKTTATESTNPSDYAWSKVEGDKGVAGANGANGVTTYTWIKYADNASGGGISNSPTSKKYIGFAYNKTTATESNNPNDYKWSKVEGDKGDKGDKGKDGINGTNGVNGIDGVNGKTTYFHTAYANNANGGGFSQNPDGKTHIGTYVDYTQSDSTDPKKYTWALFKGLDGVNGIPGVNGTNGQTSYLHIAYADNNQGGGFSQNPDGKIYLGQYTDFTQADSSNPKLYNWSKIKGDKGEQGKPGINGLNGINGTNGAPGKDGKDGINGKTTYFHVAYADNAQGGGFSQSPTDKKYIGTYVDYTSTDSSNPSLYAWVLVKGADGANGAQGIPGTNGTNGQTSYLHIAYADNNQGGGFSQSPDNKKYIGTYTDFTQADSSTPSRYVWAKIKGEDGANGTNGTDGYNGSGFYRIQNSSGSFPADTHTVNALFKSHVGRNPVRDDCLTLYKDAQTSTTRMYDGNRWISPTLYVSGDMIATGTIRGDRFVAGTEINAPVIRGGKIIGVSGDFSGKITASSGELNNVVIKENCRIDGKLSAANIEGDIYKVNVISVPSRIVIRVSPHATVNRTIGSFNIPSVPWPRKMLIPSGMGLTGAYTTRTGIVRLNGVDQWYFTHNHNSYVATAGDTIHSLAGEITIPPNVNCNIELIFRGHVPGGVSKDVIFEAGSVVFGVYKA